MLQDKTAKGKKAIYFFFKKKNTKKGRPNLTIEQA